LLIEFHSQQVDGDAAHAQQDEIHRGAWSGPPFQSAFAQIIFLPQVRQLAARVLFVTAGMPNQ